MQASKDEIDNVGLPGPNISYHPFIEHVLYLLNKTFNFDRCFEDAKHKTELCRTVRERRGCTWANSCDFAHHLHELQPRVFDGAAFKREHCCKFDNTGCSYGTRCLYIHDEVEHKLSKTVTILHSALERKFRVLHDQSNGTVCVFTIETDCRYMRDTEQLIPMFWKIVTQDYYTEMAPGSPSSQYQASKDSTYSLSQSTTPAKTPLTGSLNSPIRRNTYTTMGLSVMKPLERSIVPPIRSNLVPICGVQMPPSPPPTPEVKHFEESKDEEKSISGSYTSENGEKHLQNKNREIDALLAHVRNLNTQVSKMKEKLDLKDTLLKKISEENHELQRNLYDGDLGNGDLGTCLNDYTCPQIVYSSPTHQPPTPMLFNPALISNIPTFSNSQPFSNACMSTYPNNQNNPPRTQVSSLWRTPTNTTNSWSPQNCCDGVYKWNNYLPQTQL